MNLVIGDVVQLMSGGPNMTVSEIVAKDDVECQWQTSGGNLMTQRFHPDMLQKPAPTARTVPVVRS